MTPLTCDQQRMVEDNLSLVPWALWRFYRVHSRRRDYDDFVAAGQTGLIKAVAEYDPEQGEFSTFATWQIRGAVQRYLRTEARSKAVPIPDLDPDRLTRAESSRTCDYEALHKRTAVMFASLKPRHREILELRIYAGLTYREIGEVFDVNHRRIWQIVNSALTTLREQWPDAVRWMEAA